MRSAPRTAVVLVAIVAVAGDASSAIRAPARAPTPLRGVPLQGKTGLRLLVADGPPFVLDVDSGAVSRVHGVPAAGGGTVRVFAVGGEGAVVVRRTTMYGVRGRAARVSPLGSGRQAWPAGGGGAAWIQSVDRPSHCSLRLVGLDGRLRRAARPFPCSSSTDPVAGSLGLVVRRTRVVDPVTGRTVLRTRSGIVAGAGRKLLLRGSRNLTLLDGVTRAERSLRWPSILTGLDEAAVDPRGRFVAVAFADPTWQGQGKQVLDVWLLDLRSGTLRQLPGMPAFVSLKFTSMAWTHDGRLLLLGESASRDFVGLWRPGQKRLSLKIVSLPQRRGGSDTFAPLR